MAVHHPERAFDAAGKGQANRLKFGQKFGHHLIQGGAVDQPHLAHLFGQRRLHMFGKRHQRQAGPIGQKVAHDDRGLLPGSQTGARRLQGNDAAVRHDSGKGGKVLGHGILPTLRVGRSVAAIG